MEPMIITIFVVLLIVVIICIHFAGKKTRQLQKYWDIEIDMSEDEMLSIMGKGYNRSLLKNNRVKYEWRINGSSYGTSYKGFSTRAYTGVKKVTIYIKNGYVGEVKPYNV